MKIYPAFKTILACLLLVTIAACSSSNRNASSSSSLRHAKSGNQINLSKIPEFRGTGGEGIYICTKKPECETLQLGIYQIRPANGSNQNSFAKLDPNDPKTQKLFELVFDIAGTGKRGNKIEIDGQVEKINILGQDSFGIPARNVPKNGKKGGPLYMILVPGKNKNHLFVGINKTKSGSEKVARRLASALKRI